MQLWRLAQADDQAWLDDFKLTKHIGVQFLIQVGSDLRGSDLRLRGG